MQRIGHGGSGRRRSGLAWLALAGLILSSAVQAHEGHSHTKGKVRETAPASRAAAKPPGGVPPPPVVPVPSDLFLGGTIGGDFDLIDQHGNRRRRSDFAGRNVLLFFGYARCESICSAAIPLMSQAVEELGDRGKAIELVLITVDPEEDTPEGLKSGMQKYDPRLIGLTGSRSTLEPVWKAFQISTKEVSRDWLDQPVLAHGSFIYLLGKQGEVKTLLPPILSPKQMSTIISSYLPK